LLDKNSITAFTDFIASSSSTIHCFLKLIFSKWEKALELENMQKSLKKNELLDSISILTQRQNLFLSWVLQDKEKQEELEQEIGSIKQEYLSLI